MRWINEKQIKGCWHQWFAWYPVPVSRELDERTGRQVTRWAWWEPLERRVEFVCIPIASYNKVYLRFPKGVGRCELDGRVGS